MILNNWSKNRDKPRFSESVPPEYIPALGIYIHLNPNWLFFVDNDTANYIEAFNSSLLHKSFYVMFWLTFVQSDRSWAEFRP